MTFAAKIFVDSSGRKYGAHQTDQAGCRREPMSGRTAHDGRTVLGYAGQWYGSQMSWAPFARACAQAQAIARSRELSRGATP
jgi:hypothetical protein